MSKALDTGNIVVGVFLDLKKAFDTVDHTILLRKLKLYGIRGKVTIGSPVISITEVNLCIIMIITQRKNTLLMVFLKARLLFSILFADDTSVFIEGTNYDKIIDILNKEF